METVTSSRGMKLAFVTMAETNDDAAGSTDVISIVSLGKNVKALATKPTSVATTPNPANSLENIDQRFLGGGWRGGGADSFRWALRPRDFGIYLARSLDAPFATRKADKKLWYSTFVQLRRLPFDAEELCADSLEPHRMLGERKAARLNLGRQQVHEHMPLVVVEIDRHPCAPLPPFTARSNSASHRKKAVPWLTSASAISGGGW